CIELALERLTDSDSEAIVASMVPEKLVRAELLSFVLEKAEGVPLFTEELTRTLLEAGVFMADVEPGSQPPSLSRLEIPSTLSGLLMARLDRLGRVKQTAQLAAALGREFRFDILAVVSSTDPDSLSHDFGQLVDNGLVHSVAGAKDT